MLKIKVDMLRGFEVESFGMSNVNKRCNISDKGKVFQCLTN
jgi:hypothetical protein